MSPALLYVTTWHHFIQVIGQTPAKVIETERYAMPKRRDDMETPSISLALCEGNPSVTDGLYRSPSKFTTQRVINTGGNRTKLPSSRWHRRSFCLLVLLCDHRSLSNLQQRNTEAWYTLHQNDRLVSLLVFVQWSPKDSPRDDGRQICPK